MTSHKTVISFPFASQQQMAAFNLPIPVTDADPIPVSVTVSDKDRIAALEKKVALLSEAVVSLLVLKAEAESKAISLLSRYVGGEIGTTIFPVFSLSLVSAKNSAGVPSHSALLEYLEECRMQKGNTLSLMHALDA